jgi:hypothetical protein
MSVLAFLGVVTCGYLAGMLGSVAGIWRNVRVLPSRDGVWLFIAILLWEVVTYAPVQAVKLVVAISSTALLSLLLSGAWLVLSTCLVCALTAYVFMRCLPRRARG